MTDNPTPKTTGAAQLQALHALLGLQLRPSALKVYKPSLKDLSGTALALNLRLEPVFGEGKEGATYVSKKDSDGGLFLELAPQATMKAADTDPKFAWNDPKGITMKLGVPDITKLLTAIRCRWSKRLTPESMRAKGDEKGNTVSMFHKTPTGSAVLTYTLDEKGAFINVSKSAEHKRSIRIDIGEELQLEAYLAHALQMFQLVGMR